MVTKEWREWYSAEEYKSMGERVKSFPIHFLLALNQKETTICELMSKKVDRLTAKDPQHFNLTPLMIAAMQGKTAIAAKLLTFENVKASINEGDQFGWTALHHAALSSQEIFDQLIACGANKRCLTNLKGSVEDLKALTTLESPNLKRELPYFGPPFLKALWQMEAEIVPPAVYKIAEVKAAVPKLTVTLVKEGFYGLTADEEIAPGTVIGYYGGAYTNHLSSIRRFHENFSPEYKQQTAYLFNGYDAREVGNATRFINCGFPNIITSPILKNGVVQTILIASETIKKGEPLLYDYGADASAVTYGPQILFNKEKMHAFFKPGLEALAKLGKQNTRRIDPSDISYFLETARFSQFLFPLDNPVALLNLHYSGIVPAKEWLKSLLYLPNIYVDYWISNFNFEALQLKMLLKRLVMTEHRMNKKDYPLYQDFMLKHLESFTLVKFVKALDLAAKGDTDFALLDTYDWTQDETNLYHESNRRAAQEYDIDTLTYQQIKDPKEFFTLKKQIIEETIKRAKEMNKNFSGSEAEQRLLLIKDSIPLNQSPETYMATVLKEYKTLRNILDV